jgi:geranylgeranyl diphosphate synthase type I
MPEPGPLVQCTSSQGEAGRDVLATRRRILDPFLRDAIETMPPSLRRVAGYHLGWLDESGRSVEADSGKAIRPTMALLAAEAVGGTAEAALPAAAAVELAHNFSLIHDDVIDCDRTRRHRPTAWCVFGMGPALSTSHGLLALAFDVLAASEHPAAQGVATMLSEAVLGLLEGQSQDLSFEQRINVELAECFGMVERKTALLMSCACAAGATFGGGRPDQVDRLRSLGRHLGLAFQLVDDLLGIWGDPAATGKPVWSDLQSRKKTLPVVAALTSGTAAGRELARLYQCDGALSNRDLAHAAELIEEAGAREWSDNQVEMFVARALHDLESAEPAEAPAAELRSLADLISAPA